MRAEEYFALHQLNEETLISYLKNQSVEELLILPEDSKKGFNTLLAAAYYGMKLLVLELLALTRGEGLHSQDRLGRAPIHHLASNGLHEVLKQIFDTYPDKFDINQPNFKGRTALHSAAKWLHKSTVEVLLARGANPYALDVEGQSPLSLAFHRYFVGEEKADAPLSFPALRPLVALEYWEKQPRLKTLYERYSQLADPDHKALISAWYLGTRCVDNPHWMPGLILPLDMGLGLKKHRISGVLETELTQFVLLNTESASVLLCLDKSTRLQGSVFLREHLNLSYRDTVKKGLSKFLTEPPKVMEILGVGLAAIDAQYLALEFKAKTLILMNGYGMPESFPTPKEYHPERFLCFISSAAKLNLKGHYWWSEQANMYTDRPVELPKSAATHSLLKALLTDLSCAALCAQPPQAFSRDKELYAPAPYDITDRAKLASEPSKAPEKTSKFEELFEPIRVVREELFSKGQMALFNFARYEYCGHGWAYDHLPSRQAMLPWWDEMHPLPVERLVHHEGLYAYLLKTRDEWIIAFQGTDFSDTHSARRDLDRGSAGIKRIRHQFVSILQRVFDELALSPGEIKLIINGHSLGGADAQNFFTATLALLARTYETSKAKKSSELASSEWRKFCARHTPITVECVSKIKELHLYAYNGAGVRKSTARLAKVAARVLKDTATDLRIFVNHQRVSQDVVNTVGETVLHDFDIDTAIVRSLFFVGREKILERIQYAHTDYQFTKHPIAEHDLYDNGSEEGRAKLKQQFVDEARKIEPRGSALFDSTKQFFQRGVLSERLISEAVSAESTYQTVLS